MLPMQMRTTCLSRRDGTPETVSDGDLDIVEVIHPDPTSAPDHLREPARQNGTILWHHGTLKRRLGRTMDSIIGHPTTGKIP